MEQSVVERLRKQGLAGFPRPYDPITVGSPEESTPKQSDRPTAAERIGLLAEPTPEIVKAKEEAESGKLKVEQQRAALELAQIGRQLKILDKEAAAERRQIAEEQERQQAEEDQARLEQARATEAERRQKWFEEQAKLAVKELGQLLRYEGLDFLSDPEPLARELYDSLAKELRECGPDSPGYEVRQARERALHKALEPWRKQKSQRQILDSALGKIGSYMRELGDKGWLGDLDYRDIDLLTEQLKDPMRSILEREIAAGDLTAQQAEEVLHDAVDRRLKIV
ncbi:hypothetical protein MYX77_03310 [Acidobacteriia bacterium AH_259_A11_L15]|nr:hypothetical protein [Acidobacteriia bacterium AH_259_A11_L15]